MRRVSVVMALLAFAGCERKKSDSGLPPASDWSAKSAVELPPPGPHEGAEEGQDDPQQAGPVDPNAQMPNDSVHGGGAGQPSGVSGTLPPPDPKRAIDPTHHIRGTIQVDPKVADKITGELPLFLSVRRPDASGKPTGVPIAVARVMWTKAGMAFELTDQDAMSAVSAPLTGDVVVIAHYDRDGDAMSYTSNDVLGQARVTVPAENVVITLDTVVP